MPTTQKISVIIVTYNSNETISKLILSLKTINNYIKEIIIIDNNSSLFNKNKVKKLSPKIKIIKNKKNYGFAKAVNQGIRKSKSTFILLLNPDTYLIDNSLIQTIKLIFNDKKIGAIGGKLLTKNKQKSYTANSKPTLLTGLFEFTNLKKIFPNNQYTNKFWIEKNQSITKPTSVNSLCAAFIIFRKKIKNKLNLFNEKYFLYLEDLDFGTKINNLGFKVVFDPRSQVVHLGGWSTQNKYKTNLKEWYLSREIFFKEHLNFFASIILIPIFKFEKIILNFRNLINHEPID